MGNVFDANDLHPARTFSGQWANEKIAIDGIIQGFSVRRQNPQSAFGNNVIAFGIEVAIVDAQHTSGPDAPDSDSGVAIRENQPPMNPEARRHDMFVGPAWNLASDCRQAFEQRQSDRE